MALIDAVKVVTAGALEPRQRAGGGDAGSLTFDAGIARGARRDGGATQELLDV